MGGSFFISRQKNRPAHNARRFCGEVRRPSERLRADRVPSPWFGTAISIA